MKRRTMAFGGLLMAVAITGYSVAGTYAKYISAFDMADEARVAKWDFQNQAENTVDLFQASYSNDHGIYVASADGAKVVAPGTSGSYKYEITGTAETNYKVNKNIKIVNRIALVGDYKIDAGQEGEWEKGKIYYNPIEFCTADCDNDANWFKAETPAYDESGKFVGLTYEVKTTDDTIYPANYTLTDEVSGEIFWRWNFVTMTDAEKEAIAKGETITNFTNDVLDTNLAQMVVEHNLKMNATIGVSVEQTELAPTVQKDGNTLTTKAPVMTITNRISDDMLKEYTTEVGYDVNNSKDVIFTGTELNGTIYRTNNAYATRFMGASATKYYYLLTIKDNSSNATQVRFTGKNVSTFDLVDGSKTMMIGLQDSVKAIKFELLDAAGNVLDTKSINVNVTFNNAEYRAN